MYTFVDKGDRSLTLRPEGTAPAVRAYLEHAILNQEPLTRWFYIGPMFRYERMKTGRYRQFFQIGAEAFGSKEPAQDVELMDFLHQLLTTLGLKNVQLQMNSLGDASCRPAFQEKLKGYLQSHREALCADCQVRLTKNPLRVLDCKNEQCQEIARGAPEMLQFLCEPCKAHFESVQRKLSALKIPFVINPRIVRGLDYYTRTTFEFVADDPVLGTASTVVGGGRYDTLVKSLGGPDVPAVGWGLGLDRLAMLVAQQPGRTSERPDLFVATAEESAQDRAIELVSEWRRAGLWIDFDTRGGSLKSQMKRADKSGARYTLVLGGNELASGKGQLKPMQGGEPVTAAFGEVVGLLKGEGVF
jgi:histidyl-tRNA synthetase